MEENKGFISKYWQQLFAAGLGVAAFVRLETNHSNLATSVEDMASAMQMHAEIEKERLEKQAARLDEEDDGVKGDMIELAKANKEIANLENQVLYWKIKAENK